MESNGKLRKGIMKAKLSMSLYRASKSSSPMPYNVSNSVATNNKNKGANNQVRDMIIPDPPKQNIAPSTASTVGFIFDQNQVNPQPKQKYTYVKPPENGARDSYRKRYDNPIDIKAASYISCVQERFKLERLNSERGLPHVA